MPDRVKMIGELHDRRRFYNRILELRSSCENLSQIRENLLYRLKDLNEMADSLITEKDHDQNSRPPAAAMTRTNEHLVDQQYETRPKYTSATNDLNHRYEIDAQRRQDQPTTHKATPSNAFKLKLSLCLQEVVSKADEIVQLSDHIPKNDTLYDD